MTLPVFFVSTIQPWCRLSVDRSALSPSRNTCPLFFFVIRLITSRPSKKATTTSPTRKLRSCEHNTYWLGRRVGSILSPTTCRKYHMNFYYFESANICATSATIAISLSASATLFVCFTFPHCFAAFQNVVCSSGNFSRCSGLK